MKKIGLFLAVLAGVATLASSANASKCKSIADATQRLACYDKADGAPAPSGRTKGVNLFDAAPPNAILAKPTVRFLTPVESGPRWWIQADGGIYGFSKNSPIIAATEPPASTGPIKVPTSPGFIGLTTISTVVDPLATAAPPVFGGGGNLRMGYWLDPARTMAIEGSAFFVQGNSGSISQAPTTARTTTFINTTPDVFVGLFDDTTTTSVANAVISDQFYGADANFRMKVLNYANLPDLDVMVGLRYVALSERLTADVDSVSTRVFQPALGLPKAFNFTNTSTGTGSFTIRNDFIGPQFGFNAEKHWGPLWVGNESKLAVGAMIEQVSVAGSTDNSIAPTTVRRLAGIPITVNAGTPLVNGTGGPPSFGLFAQGDRIKTVFAVIPSGTITLGYDFTDTWSLILAYNYMYLSSVGRVGDQITSAGDIRQSGFFAQGITLGAKAQF
jgi:hypothetical protein